MEKDILQTIIAHKQTEITAQKEIISLKQLASQLDVPSEGISMKAALSASPYGIIAEFKRRSPSKGWIKKTRMHGLSRPVMKKTKLPHSPS